MLGPLPSALLMDHLGPKGLFLASVIVAASLALFVLLRVVLHRQAGSRSAFVALPDTSPASGALAPEASAPKQAV